MKTTLLLTLTLLLAGCSGIQGTADQKEQFTAMRMALNAEDGRMAVIDSLFALTWARENFTFNPDWLEDINYDIDIIADDLERPFLPDMATDAIFTVDAYWRVLHSLPAKETPYGN